MSYSIHIPLLGPMVKKIRILCMPCSPSPLAETVLMKASVVKALGSYAMMKFSSHTYLTAETFSVFVFSQIHDIPWDSCSWGIHWPMLVGKTQSSYLRLSYDERRSVSWFDYSTLLAKIELSSKPGDLTKAQKGKEQGDDW